jgi:hypothetical protein
MALTYQKEKFADIMPELPELFYENWSENEDTELPLDIDWLRLLQTEAMGILHILTARDENKKLVGYFFTYVQTTTKFASTKLAASDAIFVKPGPYRGIAIRRLFEEAKKMARDLGAKKLYIVVKAGSPVAKLLSLMKMDLDEETFSCRL